jgi:hypothetical protein
MTDPANSKPWPNEATIKKLAEQTHADDERVRHLYAEEIAALEKGATVKGFIGVVAARRVRKRLLTEARLPHHRSRHSGK